MVIVNTLGRLDHRLQATLEGIAAVAAVVIMTRMLFWMRRQGRAIKGELESQVSAALALGSTRALIGLVFIAVIREGLEMTLFFLAIIGSESGDATSAVIGGLLGLVVAMGLGWAIFAAGVRINLRRFFTVTGVLLIFVAAGLVVYAVTEFTEAGYLPQVAALFDASQDPAPVVADRIGADGHVRIPGGSDQHPGRRVPAVPGAGALPVPHGLATFVPTGRGRRA